MERKKKDAVPRKLPKCKKNSHHNIVSRKELEHKWISRLSLSTWTTVDESVDSPSLELFKVELNGGFEQLLPAHDSRTGWDLRVDSNPDYSVILCKL